MAAAVTLFALAAAGCGQSSSAPSPPATGSSAPIEAALPTVKDAKSIVRGLWSQRETDLATFTSEALSGYEMQSALSQDVAYMNAVQCGCEAQRDVHPAIQVIPQIPRASSVPVFFAQVRTTNTTNGRHPWYVLAVKRTPTGYWKIAFLTFGGYKQAPPLQKLTKSSSYTPPVSAAAYGRMLHLAGASVVYAKQHNKLVSHTNYGATVRRRPAVRPAADGVFGLTLPSGKVLSCFTMHTFDRYSEKGGLAQNTLRQQWGDLLAAGSYASVTTDTAYTQCVFGMGVGKRPGTLWLQYDPQLVATTGVRKSI